MMWFAPQKLVRNLLGAESPRLCAGFFNKPSAKPSPKSPAFVVDYLVDACGLSLAEAEKSSRYISHIRSLHKPEAVIRLLKDQGLENSQIRRLVLGRPTVLVADAEKTLQPKIEALLGAGFSGDDLARLISSSRATMALRCVFDRIQFWKSLLGGNANLLKAVDRNPHLLSFNIDSRVSPTLSYLRSVGISDSRIQTIMMRSTYLVTRHVERIKALVDFVLGIGISPDSGNFAVALSSVSNVSRSTLDSKMEFLKSLGWSDEELHLAFKRFPNIIHLSRDRTRTTMDFLVKECGCTPSYVAARSVMLGLSLQKRMIPRWNVLKALREKGLPDGNKDLYSFMLAPEKKFVDKFVVRHCEKIPGLLDSYLAATCKST